MSEVDSIGKCALADSLSDIITPPAGDVGEVVPSVPVLPDDLFSQSPAAGAPILQKYLDSLPAEDRYTAFEPLVRKHWKWLCRAAPYLKFPEPKPILEGQRINIGIRNWGMTGGGIGRVMQLFANHFAENPRYHVTIFIDAEWIGNIDYLLHENVTVVQVPSGEGIHWKEVIKKHPQDLIICPEYWTAKNAQNILLLKSLGVRVFAQEHSFAFHKIPFATCNEKFAHLSRLYSACDAVSCLSRTDAYKWQKEGTKNSIFLPNPPTFDPNSVTPSTLESNNMLWVGRWSSEKRPDMVIEVFAKVLQKVPGARLIMAGAINDRRCYRRCLRRIRALGIGHAVNIVGFQKDMVPLYSNGALLISTSNFEGWGMMITEAKTFGLPVVSTAMPYLETLKKGCIQTPPNDADALADAVVDLLQNPEKRKQLGAEGRQDMLENFSNEAVFAKYEALIEAILESPAAVAKLCAAEALMDAEAAEQMLGFMQQNFFG
jgi:glycosyltransferase involved in cell wall biosynthesis